VPNYDTYDSGRERSLVRKARTIGMTPMRYKKDGDSRLEMVVPKRMSKTMAAEIAARTLDVISPANRGLALDAALRRHGFDPANATTKPPMLERTDLLAWLLSTYAAGE
jgi:hypothetical protein